MPRTWSSGVADLEQPAIGLRAAILQPYILINQINSSTSRNSKVYLIFP
jgi:hypothetical protein